MQFMNIMKVLLLGLVLVWVSGCSSTGGGAKDSDVQSAAESEAAQAEAYKAQREAELAAQSMDAERAAAEEQERLVSITTFYFDFDQSVVKPEAQAALEAHAKNLVASGGNVVLEGHADERGTREYNLALGERRAEAVSQYLTVLGVSSQQIETVSYGEERPASRGHDDSSWSLNRRVELRYGN